MSITPIGIKRGPETNYSSDTKRQKVTNYCLLLRPETLYKRQIQELPDEIMFMIFKRMQNHLLPCQNVCRRWRGIINEIISEKTFTLKIERKFIEIESFFTLIQRLKNLETLEIYMSIFYKKGFDFYYGSQEMIVENFKSVCEKVIKEFPNLKRIVFSSCPFVKEVVEDLKKLKPGLEIIAKNCY